MLLRPCLALEADLTCGCVVSLQQASGKGTVVYYVGTPVRVVVLGGVVGALTRPARTSLPLMHISCCCVL
jgi:hypothetical protein